MLSRNPGPAHGSDQRALADHLDGPWHVICVQEGAGFVTDSSPAENFHMITPAPLRCCPQQEHLRARVYVHAERYSSWAVECMVVSGKFRRAPDKSCSYFTVANVHINTECAKRRSVCIALLLFVRDMCLKLGVVLTGDSNKGA